METYYIAEVERAGRKWIGVAIGRTTRVRHEAPGTFGTMRAAGLAAIALVERLEAEAKAARA